MSSAPLQMPSDLPLGNSPLPAVVNLTREQSESKLIELRDAAGNSRGLLLHDGGMTILYTPERLAELRRRASDPPGRTLREVIDGAVRRAQENAEQSRNAM